MKLKLISTIFLLTVSFARSQGTFIYDQQSSTNENEPGGNGTIQNLSPLGQSFTPMMTSIGFIRLQFADRNPRNSFGAA
ncbi:MAG: hypothetical protein ACR2H1_14545, partial [Limisphaerales bacterium]